ncbi:protein lap4 [Elysia marginata]|uniref:Protein lap4 n=1 Tax=Elysia marginata TaxID=1093978 RepID=A0AAV4IM62_9GAST|nr:protein lap4 [Elysia marginata]
MTIANLNLKALWLSENQAQPMLKFQTDFDERTGQRVLTCFLLPQQGFHTESMENLLKGSIATEGSFTEKDRPRDSVIRFAEDHEKVDDGVDSDDSTHFVRHDTPHPRELKARHQKFLKDRNIDGHVIPHLDNKDGSAFVPSRDQDQYYEDEDEAPGPYYKEYDREPSPANHQMLNSTYTKSPVHDGRGEDTQAPPSPRPGPPDIIKAPELTGTPSSTTQPESSSSEDEGLPQESQPLLTSRTVTMAPAPTVRIAANEVEEIDDSRDVEADGDDSSTSEKVQKSSDEESDEDNPQRDRKVGFAPEVDEESSKDHRLRRRDTPHYLKNKRVHKEEDAEQKVLEILAQAAKQRDGAALSPVVKPPELETMVAPAPATQQLPVEVQEEEITIHIVREPRQGLGISIAGGLGSTPVKGNDESIFISRVTEDGPAGKAGIMKGDKLLKVNESSLVGADHYEAVNVLKNSGNDITMVVAREKLVANALAETSELVDSTHESITTVSFSAEPETEVYGETVAVNLLRDDTGLGFSIAGGRGSVPYKGNDRAIYISKITAGGTADKSGKLQVGDRIVSINDVDLADARHDQAVNLLTGLDRSIKLVVYREKVLPKGEGAALAPPGSQRIPSITQPVINWQTSNSAAPAPARTPSPAGAQQQQQQQQQQQLVQTSSLASGPAQPSSTTSNTTTVVAVSASSSPFTSAVPTSYSYLSQSATPSLTLPDTPASQRATSSPSSPRTLSSDWTAPATTVQPPKFVYPGMSRPPSSSPSAPAPSYSVASNFSSSPPVTAPSAAAASSLSSSSPSYSNSSPSQRTSTTLLPSQTLNLSPVTLQVSRTPTTLSAPAASSVGRAAPSRDELTKVSNESPDSNHVDSRSGSISPQPYPVEDVVIVKAGGPLGLSIVGGQDHSSQPFGGDEPGVFVSKIVNDGAAARTNLRIGDRILSVNHKDLRNATHQEAVMALIAPTYEIHLTVRHDPPPPGLQELTIDKDPGEKLGLSIKGGAKHVTTPDRSDEGIFISRINEDGAAARDGRLKPGQRILEVNGQSLLGSSHQEAVRALRSIGDKLTILVCDQPAVAPPSPTPAPGVTDKGSETNSPAELSSPSSQGGLLASSLPGSSSSIDREDEESRILKQEQQMLKEAEEWEREQQVLKQQKRQSLEGISVMEPPQSLAKPTSRIPVVRSGTTSPFDQTSVTSPLGVPSSHTPAIVNTTDLPTKPGPPSASPPTKIPVPASVSPASPVNTPNSSALGGQSKIPVLASVSPTYPSQTSDTTSSSSPTAGLPSRIPVATDVSPTSLSSLTNPGPTSNLPSRIPVAASSPDPPNSHDGKLQTTSPDPIPGTDKPLGVSQASFQSHIPVPVSPSSVCPSFSPSISPSTSPPSNETEAEQVKEILQVQRQQIKRPGSPAQSVMNKQQVPIKPSIPDKPAASTPVPATGSGPKPAPFYPPTSLPRPVTFAPRPTPGPKPSFQPGAGPNEEVTSPVSPTSPTSVMDVLKSARMPSGIPKKAATNPDLEKMSFREKQKYFEKEIRDSSAPKPPVKQFSYLSEHEIATLRQEEGEEGDGTSDHDLDQVLSKMKSLEVDAVQAQAVIAKAQELSRDPANGAQQNHPNHNGDSRMELTGNQILNKGLTETRH